jgi:MoaA/NifB/PqqE/SkfB family radical SAM enzyme
MTTFIAPAIKLFQHMDRLAALQRGEQIVPVNCEIFLSNRCSHGCVWCHYAHTHSKGPLAGKVARPPGAVSSGDLMDWPLAKRILKELAQAGVESVTFSGGGEPTLHRQFDEIAEYASGVGLELGLYTHGGHIDDERAEFIKEYFKWAVVSLDECTPEAFKASKGVDRFGAVLQGVKRLVAAPGKAVVGLSFLVHAGNWRDIHDMVRLGKELGVTYVQFRPTILYDQEQPGKLVESDTAWIRHAIGRLNAYKGNSFVIADTDRFEMYANWRGHGYDTCYGAALQTAISPSGQVWRCTNKTEHPDALLGDLSTESFGAIWARSGGPCAVDGACRILCRQHIANLTLTPIMAQQVHANFI